MHYSPAWIDCCTLALGLQWPSGGHPNSSLVRLDGFGGHNVMAETQDKIPKRFHFTLGQVYRMNADSRSMLLTAGLRPGAGIDCGCDPIATNACPALGRNVAPLEIPITWGGTCPD